MIDTPTESTWTRLRRRKVVQWGLAYAAGAWALLQVLGFAADAFAWPVITKQLAMLGLAVGLPLAVALAWFHGDRGQQGVTGPELAVLTLLLLLGGGLLWAYAQRSATTTAAAVKPSPTAAATDARPSIAVLPFENRSDVQKDAFFVDGIHDDILTQLSKVSALKVISRTSVERFRNTELPMKDIAQQLGATTILEGAVQRAGERVRINVQLIDAATDQHLWAETYDRELTAPSIFAIQSEVATAIAAALHATLTSAEKTRVNSVLTSNLDAWTAYQVGRQRMSTRTTSGLADAVQSFERALELDAEFALAYVGLADALFLQTDYSSVPEQPAMSRAEEMLSQALRLDPDLPEALTTAAKFAQNRSDFASAEAGYRRAISLNPNYATAYFWYSGLLSGMGSDAEALRFMTAAVELDPLSPVLRLSLGYLLGGLGRFDEGQVQFAKMREIDPTLPGPHTAIGNKLAWADGRLDEAAPWLEKAAELDPASGKNAADVAELLIELGDYAGARSWLARALKLEPASVSVSEVAAIMALYGGKSAEAAASAQRGFDANIDNGWNVWPLRLLRDFDLRNGHRDDARARYARFFPELLDSDPAKVLPRNYRHAIDCALVLQLLGDRETSARLLEASQAALRSMPRMGVFGYGVADVQIHALRGENRQALQALRDAQHAGWRGPYWRYYRDFDPNLASIRNEPEFKAIFGDIERDLVQQRARLAARPKGAPLELSEITNH